MSNWESQRLEQLPPYAFATGDALKQRVRDAGADLIDLSLGNPDGATPAAILEVLHAEADKAANHRYHPGRGVAELRRAIASWYRRRYGVALDHERETMVTMGTKEGISHLCLALLSPGDVAVVPDPCYPVHAHAPRLAGARVETYPAMATVIADEIGSAIARVSSRGQRVKLVIANFPQNPTGRTIRRDELADVLRVTSKAGALLLHDLAYADLDFGQRFAPSIFDCGLPRELVKRFAVETFSMSKSYNMPGWRVGFIVGSEQPISALAHLKNYLDYGTFAPLQLAAAWALEHGDGLVDEVRARYALRAEALAAGLRAAGFSEAQAPSGGMFVWARIPPRLCAKRSLALAVELIEMAHVATAAGGGFGARGDEYLRFALIEDMPRIREACTRVARYVREHGAAMAESVTPRQT